MISDIVKFALSKCETYKANYKLEGGNMDAVISFISKDGMCTLTKDTLTVIDLDYSVNLFNGYFNTNKYHVDAVNCSDRKLQFYDGSRGKPELVKEIEL